jgi:sensor domain CHASE-containing protein
MWMGTLYDTFARTDTSPQRRQEDWAAAAQSYTRAAESWQKLHGRPDFNRYQAEIADCTKKAAESNHRANSHV